MLGDKETSMKAWIRALTVTAVMGALGTLAAADPPAKATLAEKDAFVLFELSYNDAADLKDPTIKVSGKDGKRNLTYAEHVLSCGTHMNGTLRETTKGNVLSVKGSFAVKENPYEITQMEIDLAKPKGQSKWTGFLVVDGTRVPVELVQ